ncbi:sphingosine kinase [Scheffersomyces xylosifermentans]|uniref:sphingosine kinase n=1 Tax=Scheffersomyces xylosifermentans TaxID=1304137 RepID=UPI00315DE98B
MLYSTKMYNTGQDINISSERLLYHTMDGISASLDDLGIKIASQVVEATEAEHHGGLLSYCISPRPSLESAESKSHIPYKNILWVEPVTDDTGEVQNELEVTYAKASGKHSVKPTTLHVQISNYKPNITSTQELANYILSKAYKNHIIEPTVLVVINPHGGQGKAVKIYNSEVKPILRAAKAKITYQETNYHEHAVEIARDLDISKYDIIACCSGDGIPHEIINGFFQRPDKGVEAFNKVAISQLPCGSGNALSLSTHGSNDAALATVHMLKAMRTKLDLMAVTQGVGENATTKLSFLTQCYGIIADADIGTEHLRWLGPMRFDLGVAQRVLNRSKYPCELYVNFVTKSKQDISAHFETHHRRVSSSASNLESVSEEEDYVKLPTLTEENLQIKGPQLDESPPSSWVRIDDSIAKNINILYVGKMPYISNDVQFFPAALPNDGYMDMILTDTNTSVLETTSILMSLDKGLHVHNEKVHHAKILSYRLVPKLPGHNHYISVDGESFPFEPLQVEVLPGVLTGLLQGGNFVETCYSQ